MTEQMRHFLTELAELMERYDIDEITTVETCHGWEGSTVDNLNVSIISKWDSEGNQVQEYCDFELPSYIDAEMLRRTLEKAK